MQMREPAPKQVVGVVCVSGEWKCVVAECRGMIGDEQIQMSTGETQQCAVDSPAGLPSV